MKYEKDRLTKELAKGQSAADSLKRERDLATKQADELKRDKERLAKELEDLKKSSSRVLEPFTCSMVWSHFSAHRVGLYRTRRTPPRETEL